MALWITDNAVTLGADGTVLTADAASTHGVKFATSGGSGAMTRISQVVTSGSQATVVFSSIASTYTNLQVLISGRDTSAAANSILFKMFCNADTTSGNYQSQLLDGSSTSTASATGGVSSAGADIGVIPGTLTIATSVGAANIFIPNYAQTTFFKSALSSWMEYYTTAATGMVVGQHGYLWKSTAAINTLTFTAGGTAFVNGSIFTLYGIA